MATTTVLAKDTYYKEAIEQVEDLHGDEVDLTDFTPFLRAFYELSDQSGFCIDFDMWWKAAGFTLKENAKRLLTGRRGSLGLKEGVDYKIDVGISLVQLDENSFVPPTTETRGRKPGVIALTYRAAGQLALAAQTRQGTVLRDAVLQLVAANKRFQRALARGDIEIHPGRGKRGHAGSGDRDHKRLKVCESQKALMREISSCEGVSGATFGRINGETNKAVTGRYAYETAKMLGKKKVNARDYMTPAQLVLAEAAEELTKKVLTEQGGDPEETHKSVLERIAAACELTQGEIAEQKRDLKSVRAELLAVKDSRPPAPAPQKVVNNVNNINNYFSAKVTTVNTA